MNHTLLVLIGILLFVGAMGKSAQFPLHTWLADAMEGPTPVSALIHAATMVTAGVYLVIRSFPLYSQIPEVSYFIAVLGTFVAIFAASMALVNRDLKRIIAYSTLSQLGYMFAAAGLGAYWVALFHLAAHAFFKALLFLGAGNVMHAMHDELDIFKMGGLKKVMRWTYLYMGVASLALAGIWPFAGFFSKDTILEAAFNEHTYGIWFVLWFTAGLTAFYSFRLVFLTFWSDERYKQHGFHPHEVQN
jgi:NADH-quinone oxidoreductase subunit L